LPRRRGAESRHLVLVNRESKTSIIDPGPTPANLDRPSLRLRSPPGTATDV
jgi:hypothetical protein